MINSVLNFIHNFIINRSKLAYYDAINFCFQLIQFKIRFRNPLLKKKKNNDKCGSWKFKSFEFRNLFTAFISQLANCFFKEHFRFI